MSDRIETLLDRMFEFAECDEELWSEVISGPETEDTTAWLRTDEGAEVWERTVYPAMAALPSVLLRTLTFSQARAEIDAKLRKQSDDLLGWYEHKWTKIALTRRPFETPFEFAWDRKRPDEWTRAAQYDVLIVKRKSADTPSLYTLTINRRPVVRLNRWPAVWMSNDDPNDRATQETAWAAEEEKTAEGRIRLAMVDLYAVTKWRQIVSLDRFYAMVLKPPAPDPEAPSPAEHRARLASLRPPVADGLARLMDRLEAAQRLQPLGKPLQDLIYNLGF